MRILAGISRHGKWWLAALVVAAGIGWWRASALPVVQTTPVVLAFPSQAVSVLNATGYIVAQRKASLSSKATGRLEWLGVAEGSVVRQGQLIARIESRDTQAQLEQTQAQVQLAQAELTEAEQGLRRSENLLAQRFISAASHDAAIARHSKAKASVSVAQASLRVAQANLAQTEIRAPFDAVVLTKNANVGDNITPFSSAADTKGAVVSVADMSTLEVEVDVSESNLSKLSIGQPAEIGLDAIPGERFPGRIVRMVPTIDRAKATRLVKVKFDQIDARALPDMSAKVVFLSRAMAPQERKPVVSVSAQAVALEDGKPVVFLLEGDRLKRIELSAAAPAQAVGQELVAVPTLTPGSRVVIRPVNLQDGQRVKVASP